MKSPGLSILRLTAPCCLALALIGCGPDKFIPISASFTLAVTPSTTTLTPGATPTPFTAQITPSNGFSAAVVFSVPSVPAGILCQETACATTIAAGTTTGVLHLAPSPTVAPGTYSITFTAVSGSITQTATATIIVPAPVLIPDFTLSVTPNPSSTSPGVPAPAESFTITPINGFASPVTITGSAPTGIACSLSPCSVTTSLLQLPNALQFTPAATVAYGTYFLTFTATSGSLTHTVTVPLVIASSAPDFTFAVSPTDSSASAGGPAIPESFTITPINGFASPVTITTSLPAGITCSLSPCSLTTSLTQLNDALQFATASTLAPGTYTLTFTATSGTLTHTAIATITILAPPDFEFAVSPTASSTTAGTAAPPESFTITPLNGFASPVTITESAPTGIACSPSPCIITTNLTQLNDAMQFTPAATVASGTYTLTFTATSGSLVHTATATLTIGSSTAPLCFGPGTVTSPRPGPTSFVYLGDNNPPASLYDAAHNHIFVSNHQLGEVDVVDPNCSAIIARIPVPAPEGLDLTADGTLIVGTETLSFYRINTATLAVIDNPSLTELGYPPILGATVNVDSLGAWFPFSLADGSVVFVLIDDFDGVSAIALWNTSGATYLNPANHVLNFYAARRSGDRQHVIFASNDTGSADARYDASTNTFAYPPETLTFTNPVLNQDGSHLYAVSATSPNTILSIDAGFHVLASYTSAQAPVYNIVLSPDGSRLYVDEGPTPVIAVLDTATMRPLGFLPSQVANGGSVPTNILGGGPYGGGGSYDIWDGTGRILASTAPPYPATGNGGLMLFKPDATLLPDANTATFIWSPLAPDDIESGSTTVLQYYSPSATTVSGTFSIGAITQTVPATPGSSSAEYIAPAFPSGCADFVGTFNIGTGAAIPNAFCYAPIVTTIDGDTGPSTGGNTLTLFGKGFGAHPSVTIGGQPATITAPSSNGSVLYGFDPESLTVTVPPGTPGPASIVVTQTSGQSITLTDAYTYVTAFNAPFPSGAQPVQIIYDAVRDRLLWTDAGRNKLVIASSSTGQSTQEVTLPSTPGGLSLSPDGAHLFVTFPSTTSIAEYDATTFTSLASITIPSPDPGFPISGPYYAAALNTGQAIAVVAYNPRVPPGFLWDPTANQLQPLNTAIPVNFGCGGGNFGGVVPTAGVSADGSHAVIDSILYAVSTGTFASAQGDFCAVPGITDDGSFTANGDSFDNAIGSYASFYEPPSKIVPDTGGFVFTDHSAFQVAINPTGSIAARLDRNALWLFEPATGALLHKLNIPVPSVTYQPFAPLTLDPAGLRYWLFTPTGITGLTFEQDPLALGEALYDLSGTGSLTILGSGFTPATVVAIDGSTVPATFIDAQHLQLNQTFNLGSHSVLVTNPDGQTSYLPLAFRVVY